MFFFFGGMWKMDSVNFTIATLCLIFSMPSTTCFNTELSQCFFIFIFNFYSLKILHLIIYFCMFLFLNFSPHQTFFQLLNALTLFKLIIFHTFVFHVLIFILFMFNFLLKVIDFILHNMGFLLFMRTGGVWGIFVIILSLSRSSDVAMIL